MSITQWQRYRDLTKELFKFVYFVYIGGNKIFCHQIGDELEDFELNKQKGNALILEQILGAPKDKVAFIINETEDVLSSEDYAFDLFDIK